jgi:hypothetical protein
MLTPLQSSCPQSRTSSCSCTCASAVCYRLGPGPRLLVLLLLHYFCVLPGPSTFLACFTPDCCPCIYSTTSINPPPSIFLHAHPTRLAIAIAIVISIRHPQPRPAPDAAELPPTVIARQTTPRPARALLHTYRYTTLAGARPFPLLLRPPPYAAPPPPPPPCTYTYICTSIRAGSGAWSVGGWMEHGGAETSLAYSPVFSLHFTPYALVFFPLHF